ncbi:hypothetical protein SJAV_27500 [Sulfurisphaera javensis]|uniref:Uncharacterized protein n=1 Tax=Sulfurisphaera javensis TaxID=2049879 RepID=A0AAT9GVK9_9CREN
MSMRSISRVSNRDVSTVYHVIRKIGLNAYLALLDLQGLIKNYSVREKIFDEQWTFYRVRRGSKRCDLWNWTCLADGVPYSSVHDKRNYDGLSSLLIVLPRGGVNYSDDYQVYQVLDNHQVGKQYTYRIESFHSMVRSCLARFNRFTKAVNRSISMVEYSLSLLIVMRGKVFSKVPTPFNQVWLENVKKIRESLI